MRNLLPALSLAMLGCAPEYTHTVPPPISGSMNPRPLEATTQTDRILQVTQPEVDVLWVIDDSGSMGSYQDRLAKNFPIFFDFFEGSGLDYHIGVVSTDMYAAGKTGKLITKDGYRFLDPDTPNADVVFSKMSMLGTGGSATEKGKDATYTALEIERNGYNVGFLRDKSAVHVIVVTDEDDSSTIVTSDEMGAYLNGLRQDPDDVTFSAIVNYSYGSEDYVPVKNLVGGIEWSIQDQDWTDLLKQLGLQAAGLKREYFLSQLPVPGSIRVSVVEGGITFEFTEGDDWEYNPVRNSISFHQYVPNPMAEVLLTYDILSSHHGE